MSEKVLVDREQLERAASVVAWMSCRSDIKATDMKRLEQCASELSCALTAPAAQAERYGSYVTTPGESVAGIAARQLGDQSRWIEIRDLNALEFPDMGPHDYYPVGTKLVMPKSAPPAQPDAPRCQCCGYLVTQSEHRGCLRSASVLSILQDVRDSVHYHKGMQDLGHEAGKRHAAELAALIERIDAALAGKGGGE